MTWTKLGDEFPPEAKDLTDAEFRTHVEALCWSNLRLLDLHIPKAEVRRFAESREAAQAVDGLVVKDWWEDRGDAWYIGMRFPEWQRDRSQVEHRRASLAEAQRRSRRHRAGDHSLCLPGRCKHLAMSTVESAALSTRDPGRVGSGTTYPPDPEDQDQDQAPEPDLQYLAAAVGDSAANSQNHRVPHGPDSATSDDQHNPVPATLQSQATDRNARASATLSGTAP